MSGDESPVLHGPIRERSPALIPDQTCLELMDDQHSWDTINVCNLIGKLFGKAITLAEITKVIEARTARALGPLTVKYMFRAAQVPSVQKNHPTTCRYQKWEAVKKKLEKRKGKRDITDAEERSAWVLYKETFFTLKAIENGELGPPAAW